MNVAWDALWYVIGLSFLVIVHEYGHFWVARRLGFKVLRFSIGFGKPIWSRVVGADQTELVIAPIPMGGYVKMLDERDGPVPPEFWRDPSPASRPGNASWCYWPARPSTCCLPSCCCGACAGFRASMM